MPTKWIYVLVIALTVLNAEKYTLDRLCKQAIENHPKIKSFAYKSSASQSYYDQSIDKYKPHLNIDAQVAQQQYTLGSTLFSEDYNGVSYQYQFSLKQPVYRATLLSAITDAKDRILLSQLLMEDEKAKLVTQILQSTFELLKLKKTIHILTQKEQILERAYGNIEKKHALKFASKTELYQALSMFKQSQSDLVIARQQYSHTLYNLKLLTKTDNVEKYVENLDYNIAPVKAAYKKLNIEALSSKYRENTRVELERQTVKIAKGQIDLRKKERYPNIDAVVSYGDTGGTIDATVRQNDSRAMLTLNFPLYQGGYVSDRVEEARFLALSAQESADDIELNIKISLEKSIQDLRSGLESVYADGIATQASEQYFKAALESYRNGLGSLTDAYLAEADYHDNRLRLVTSETNLYVAMTELYYYSGMSGYKYIQELQKKYFKE